MTQSYDPLASVQAAGPPGTISFIYGLPDPATFPAEDLRRALDTVLRTQPALALQYGPEQGFGPLIDYLRGKLAHDEGLVLDRPQIMLTGGSSQALDQLCTLFARPGDAVLVEAPTYHDSIHSLSDHGLQPMQVPTDEGGVILDALAERLEALAQGGQPARLLYVIPSFQNPSGVTLAASRREPLLELAERYSLLVVEDDVYRDLVYEGQVPPSLFALDRRERVLRLGTFSKTMAPALRLGWLIGPPALLQRVIESGFRCMGGGANPLISNAIATYCQWGLLEPHIESLRQLYRQRRDAALAGLEAHMPPGVGWTRPTGGTFVWLTLPGSLDAREAAARARDEGVWILPGHPFFAEGPTGQHLRLAFSYVPQDQISSGLETLGRVISSKIPD